ncbi:ureidoglycolate lyase [Chytriomyces confervae]|uniref:Ureidoglycolate lyase n=1 Tax=Chytriomyces confervae TaxID=246404 RepID=A0A507EJL3_9FUNG|nr:ureidoglycolate lyase [Chytriomyces confervae]
MRIVAEPLTRASFAAFGSVIEVPAGSDADSIRSSANQSSAAKYSPISVLGHSYAKADKVQPVMSLFHCNPRALSNAGGQSIYTLSLLERHAHTTQTFIPMGLSPLDTQTRFLVIVAPYQLNEDRPDWTKVRAFVARGNQGVTYGVGVWHAPMVVIGAEKVLFSVLMWNNGVPEDECTECEVRDGVDQDVQVVVPLSSVAAKL